MKNGCSENEISFENTIAAEYANADAPSDNSCHIFNDMGGKIEFSTATTYTTDALDWVFSSSLAIVGIGTNSAANTCSTDRCTELTISIGSLNDAVCNNLNQLANAPEIVPEAITGYGGLFAGTYTNTDEIGNTLTTYRGTSSACLDGDSGPLDVISITFFSLDNASV